ncbi:DUF881 domain-containing protein [Streptomyces otsuchiensis]|uniref:DUF881 domain-containing protein n=1 Tax=Streptomyces otsuchiensis TaxID=2681388 RepID=UPI0010305966|nr:DUF881 domain-containing protein [Streptomyces otsuchiensis]
MGRPIARTPGPRPAAGAPGPGRPGSASADPGEVPGAPAPRPAEPPPNPSAGPPHRAPGGDGTGDRDGAGGEARPGADGESKPPTGRDALLSGLWPPRFSRAQLIVAALLFVLGLGLAVQIRAAGEDGALRGARPEDLVRILSDLDERTKRLDDERGTLERQRTELETSSDQEEEVRKQNRERELQLGVLAGTVAATGPGIDVRISDPGGAVGADRLLDAVQELRAAGAEAMQINDVRVVASTSFVDGDDQVLIDGEPVDRPFRIEVIGRPHDLEPALNIPGGVVQSLEKEGATVTVNRPDEVTVDALRSAEQPDYAQSSS